jgi:astacin
VANPSFCGLSYIGKVSPANPVYLSFMCQDPVGIAIHETMHALGANHEQLRSDRDMFLDINWSNINPQFYDHFAIADPSKFTSFGIPYDYGSIMQYQAFTAAIDTSRPTMSPRVNPAQNQPLMGQRKRLGDKDAQLLNAMYCKTGCEDTSVYCGFWALQNTCQRNSWMQQNCLKSCQLC